jgi:putative metallohydrolase (TIGR04338 family)
MRDFQKSKFYGVEEDFEQILLRSYEIPSLEVYGSNVILSPERRFGDVVSAQRYVDSVLSLNWVKSQWGKTSITVRKRKGHSEAVYKLGTIALPEDKWGLRECILIHEMAHHFDRTNYDAASHGPDFIGIQLALIEGLMSPENAFVFSYLLNESGVKFTRLG